MAALDARATPASRLDAQAAWLPARRRATTATRREPPEDQATLRETSGRIATLGPSGTGRRRGAQRRGDPHHRRRRLAGLTQDDPMPPPGRHPSRWKAGCWRTSAPPASRCSASLQNRDGAAVCTWPGRPRPGGENDTRPLIVEPRGSARSAPRCSASPTTPVRRQRRLREDHLCRQRDPRPRRGPRSRTPRRSRRTRRGPAADVPAPPSSPGTGSSTPSG